MKRIGISYTEARFQNYWNWFSPEDLGDEIQLIALSFQEHNEEDIYNCDGFVLTGGIDVLPAIYGGAEDYPHMPDTFMPERDEFERLIYDYAQKELIPVLGICRGMQYINIMEGGKVFEDNGEQTNQVHKNGSEDKIHGVNIQKDSLLFSITGVENGKVNSAHHQGVKPQSLGKNIRVSAYADTEDAMIEALEFKDKTGKGFMLGVQWHPERMQEKDVNPLSQKIKEQFINAVKNYAKVKEFP